MITAFSATAPLPHVIPTSPATTPLPPVITASSATTPLQPVITAYSATTPLPHVIPTYSATTPLRPVIPIILLPHQLVEMAISSNPKPTMYRNLYENGLNHVSRTTY